MNAADVVGYALDGDTYCTVCCPESTCNCPKDENGYCEENCGGYGPNPIFASAETDCPMHCSECGELLPTSWTVECVEYVKQAVLGREPQHDHQAVVSEWVDYFLGGEWPRAYTLVDDGTLDTVVSVFCSGCGRTSKVRLAWEYASQWRDESGAFTEDGWRELCSELEWDFVCVCEGE